MMRLISLSDLMPSEQRFLFAMRGLVFGRFEFIPIEQGELVLHPWPTMVQTVKLGASQRPELHRPEAGFAVKDCVADLFCRVRAINRGEVRKIEVRHGLPVLVELELPIVGSEGLS